MKKGRSVLRWMRVRLEIGVTEVAQLVRTETRQAFGVSGDLVLRVAFAELLRDGGDVGQLHRALHPGVAGEDLLDQGRPGAGHTENEDRVGSRAALTLARGEQGGREHGDAPADMAGNLAGIIIDQRAAPAIAFRIMMEGGSGLPQILQRLAEREMEMEAILPADRRVRQRGLHRGGICRIELHRLQIGEAPPDLAQPGGRGERAAIGGDAVRLPADRLQQMAVAHPDLRLIGEALQHGFVKRDRLLIGADAAERGRLQILVGLQVDALQRRKRVDRLGRPVLLVEHGREIGAGRREAGRQLQRAAQQMLRVLQPPDTGGQLRHHPDRGDVGRLVVQARAENVLDRGQVVVEQSLGGAHQLRIVDGDADRVEFGLLSRLVLAAAPKCRAEQAEGVGIVGRGLQDLARLHSGEPRIVPQQPAGDPQRIVHRPGRCPVHGAEPSPTRQSWRGRLVKCV